MLLLTFIGSIVNLIQSLGDHERLYSAALILALSFAGFLAALFARIFALKAQDRAIRTEENLRHFVITGKLRLEDRPIGAPVLCTGGTHVSHARHVAGIAILNRHDAHIVFGRPFAREAMVRPSDDDRILGADVLHRGQ